MFCAEQRPGGEKDPSELKETCVKANVGVSVVPGETRQGRGRVGPGHVRHAEGATHGSVSEQSSSQPVTVVLTMGWKEPRLMAGRAT